MTKIEEILNERKVPDVMKMSDGSPVTRENAPLRRKELLDILSEHIYGTAPEAPEKVDVKVMKTDEKQFAGKARVRKLELSFMTDKGVFAFPVTEVVPYSEKKVPTFVLVNFRPDCPDKYCPVEELLDSGCAVLIVYYNDIAFDGQDFFKGGLAAMYDRDTYSWGKIRMWAWAASRVMDYLQTADFADLTRIGVTGHSRLGKTSLVCAAYDERFAIACANDSGCSGDAITREKKGERVKDITRNFPFWFCDRYRDYCGAEDKMPFDQHFLLSAIAPRAIAQGSALEDEWADPESQYLSACAATPMWKIYGKAGLIHPDRLPVAGDTFDEGDLSFHLRAGTHYFSREDWKHYADALKKI